MTDMKALKILTLIKFSKLPYIVEELTEVQSRPLVLRTGQGELSDEYEIVGYVVNDAFGRSLRRSESRDSEDKGNLWGDVFALAKMN